MPAIQLEAHGPLTRGRRLDGPVLVRGTADVSDFGLAPDDMALLDALDKSRHFAWDPPSVP